MNTATKKPMDACAQLSLSIAPYLDGELDADHAIDLESHVVSCANCAERVALLRATRSSLKRTSNHRAPPDLASKIRATMAAERERAAAETAPSEHPLSPKLIRLRYAVGLAAAAGVVFAMGMSRYFPSKGPTTRDLSEDASPTSDTASATVGFDKLLDELIALHARPLPPDVTNPDDVQRFNPLVGVQVRRPAFQPFGASFNGARVHPVADRGALLQLQYTVPSGKHVTVYVFDPRVVPVQATRLERRMVSQRPILMGRLRGYSVAAAEEKGVGYAFASDLDTDESTSMVLATLQQQ